MKQVKSITTGNIANFYHVSRCTVLAWIDKGYIQPYRLPGNHYRFTLEEINRFANKYKMPKYIF